jgi:predicted RNA binding protein YcfA (HicA-like mRNA interferase family)
LTGRQLIRLLEKEGWRLDRISGSHHIMVMDQRTLSVPVHGNKDLGKGLLSALIKLGGLKR